MIPRGSYSDYLILAARLEAYERAERIATLLGCQWASRLADEAHDKLTIQAIACGLPWLRDESIVDWSRRRSASFQNMRRAA